MKYLFVSVTTALIVLGVVFNKKNSNNVVENNNNYCSDMEEVEFKQCNDNYELYEFKKDLYVAYEQQIAIKNYDEGNNK